MQINQKPSYPEPLFRLPNGHHLKFKLKKCYRGDQFKWKNTYIPTNFKYPSVKDELPLLGLWNSESNQHLITLDIDELPSNFNSWSELLTFCKKQYPNQLVNHSYSGKVKVWFLVEAEIMNQQVAERFLAEHLPEDQPIKIDPLGVSKVYFDARIASEVSEWLELANPIQYQVPTELQPTFTPKGFRKYDRSHTYKMFEGEITEPKLLKFIGRSEVKEKLIRILLLSKGLIAKSGFGLSIIKLSREIECDSKMIKKALKSLVELGYLKVIDSSYVIGKKARLFVARKTLKKEIKKLQENLKKFKQKPLNIPEIKDGEFNDKLFKLALKVFDEKQYLEIVNNIPGIALKDRLSKAQNVWTRVVAYRQKHHE